ncbi:CvpA family protein [Dehalobacter sp. DCM]|uniref:CvpA family protein n=1 Tax=Dehalobacter sp. DCM TaxID=2907827 RepID=UPI0030819D76|nr:CvpA family protein [Dehalobacter sp. DCM]
MLHGFNRKKTPRKRRPPLLTALLITLVFAVIYFYVVLPAINLQNTEFYLFLCLCLALFCFVTLITRGMANELTDIKSILRVIKKYCAIPGLICIGLALVVLLGSIYSSVILHARSYSEILPVTPGDFAAEVEQISYDQIPMLDKTSAQRLGDRKLGELSDMVSQFEVVNDYTQINYKDRPVRIATLAYGDIFKWLGNRAEGIPAYIIIDMVTQNVNVVRLQEGIKYTNAEHFSRYLYRHLRFNFPTYMFDTPHFEIDDNGHPYWICPRMVKTIGLFGGTDIKGAVMVDAVTGESTYYENVPSWVDQVYSAELIIQQYDYHGRYASGLINSIFGQKGVTVTTDGYNYIAQNDDVYVYTGITSVTGDQSNIGFILCNQRTKEARYYSCAGAEEFSAMNSAQGVVQHLGYVATFPLLLNISDQPTYFVALKDNAALVKMYAMVNVQKYNIVATGTTVAECEMAYIRLLKQNGLIDEVPAVTSDIEGVVKDIRVAVVNGTSVYYLLLDSDNSYFAISAAESRNIVLVNVGDRVGIRLVDTSTDAAIVEGTGLELKSDQPKVTPKDET